jgi:membrane protein YqaA with SNARE-associated domain
VNLFAPTAAKAAHRAHHSLVPRWVMHLGPLGLFLVSIVDSSVVPLPIPGTTDLLLLWMVARSGNPWLLAVSAIAGSLLGGYTTWQIGQRGGEAALQRWVSPRLLDHIVAWVKKHPVLSVFLPAVLPPPIPLSPFILASGALGVSRNRFLLVFGSARVLRYSLIAWFALSYGRRAVRLWSKELQQWSTPLLWTFVTVLVVGIGFSIWQFLRHRKSNRSPKAEDDRALHAARAD